LIIAVGFIDVSTTHMTGINQIKTSKAANTNSALE
jgi:hypothetical protein